MTHNLHAAPLAALPEPTIAETIHYIETLFSMRRDLSNEPFHLHSVAVMESLPDHAPHYVKLAALLHDVIEDTQSSLHPVTRTALEAMGYRKNTLDMVELLTKPELREGAVAGVKIPYNDRIRGIIASDDYWAIKIKCADVTHNMSKARQDRLHPETSAKQLAKYRLPHRMLTVALDKFEMGNTGATRAH